WHLALARPRPGGARPGGPGGAEPSGPAVRAGPLGGRSGQGGRGAGPGAARPGTAGAGHRTGGAGRRAPRPAAAARSGGRRQPAARPAGTDPAAAHYWIFFLISISRAARPAGTDPAGAGPRWTAGMAPGRRLLHAGPESRPKGLANE